MKKVVAVEPYWHNEALDFKHKAYNAWIDNGGRYAPTHYPPKWTHPLMHRIDFPSILQKRSEARLRFVQPINFWLDAFPDYMFYEVIPIIWDCWQHVRERTSEFFKRYKVQTAVFTSSQTAELFRERFPLMNILTITEGIDTMSYLSGDSLRTRSIDLLEFGRDNHLFPLAIEGIRHIRNEHGKVLFSSNLEFRKALSDTKIVIAQPKSVSDPNYAKGIETLTQRYWECMLSRVIMVGKAPKELMDLIGYDPVIPVNKQNPVEQIEDILAHVEDYQSIVDQNRETALRFGDWSLRMKLVMEWLKKIGYDT